MKNTALFAALLFSMMLLTGCAASGQQSQTENGNSAEKAAAEFSPEKAFAEVICPAEEALKWAEENPIAVSGENCSGHEIIASFFKTSNDGKPASVLCAKYYELHPESMSAELYEAEKDQYPVLYFFLVEYDGGEYRVRIRDSRETTPETDETYQHLVFLNGENPESALTKYTDEYDLVDDPDITLEELKRSMYSSSSGDWIRHKNVFTDFHD